MIHAITGITPDEIAFGGNHVLFVEGKEDSIDVTILKHILKINVKPLGPSFSIKSIAQAFVNVHPTYYFLIDRDHYDDETVEKSWCDFPNADTPNLLIWKKKEIENYFLDSSFLCQSIFFDKQKKEMDIQKKIIREAQQIIYMAVVNQVIISIREDFKMNWIHIFRNHNDFQNKETALSILLKQKEFSDFSANVTQKTSKTELQNRFQKYLSLMTGGESSLKWDKGKWRDMIPGKAILHSVLGSKLFTVTDREGKSLNGTEKETEIVKELLSVGKKIPDDFLRLQQIINERTSH